MRAVPAFFDKSSYSLVLPEGDGVVRIQAYTGRSFTAGLCCRLAIAKLMKKVKLNETE